MSRRKLSNTAYDPGSRRWLRCLTSLLALFVAGSLAGPLAAQVERMRIFDVRTLGYPDELERGPLPEAPGNRAEDGGSILPAFSFEEEDRTGSWLGVDQIENAIRRFVAPESWANRRNELTVNEEAGTLAVIQTPEVLERIEEFLSFLGARASRLVSVDLALVPPQALHQARPGWDEPGESPWLDGESLDEILGTAEGAELLSCVTPPGAWRRLSPGSVAHHLVDYAYVGTGVIPTIRPVVAARPRGPYVEVLVLPSPDGTWCRIDVKLGEARTDAAPPSRRIEHGDLELLGHANAQVGTTAVLRFGEIAVLGGVRMITSGGESGGGSSDPRSFVALARVRRIEELAAREGRAVPEQGAASDQSDALPAALDASLLIEPRKHCELGRLGLHGETFESTSPLRFDDDSDEKPLASLVRRETLPRLLGEAIAGAAGDHSRTSFELLGGTVFVSPSSSAGFVERRLEELARRKARVVAVDLVQASVSAQQLARAGDEGGRRCAKVDVELNAEWLRSVRDVPGFRARLVGLSGWDLTLGSVAGRNYVADIEYVSGGTGQVLVELGDPVVASAIGGLLLTVRADPIPGTEWIELHLRGESGRPPIFERETRVRSTQALEPIDTLGRGGAAARDVQPTGRSLTVDLPEQDSDRWEHVVTAERGKPVLLSAFPDATRPGRTRVLVATVEMFSLFADAERPQPRDP